MSKYLDYSATTPLDTRVLEAMQPYFTEHFGNANSLYKIGRDAYHALEDARTRFAAGIGAAQPSEVIFTSGGTEADNAAFFSVLRRIAPDGGHIVTSAYEHHAVLEVAEWLGKHGYELSIVSPRADGRVHADDLQAVLRDDTKLVSIMHSNNEIGAINDLQGLAAVAHAVGAVVHTDAVQSLGKVPFNVGELDVDMASFSAHKIHGPKGVGALYLKRGTAFDPLIKGGGQESRRRSGTQNVAGAIGFARALELMLEERDSEYARLSVLRDKLLSELTGRLENTQATIDSGERLPNIAPLLINGVEGESMLLQLDNLGWSVSTGSACSSGSLEPSHVLLAIGVPQVIAHGSLRVSMGRDTTEADIEEFIEVLIPIVERLRAMSPVYHKMFGSK
ncbi:MAG: cysteine desulfurase [Actinomycetes bacterium]|jgi:cysteine desulfurase|nr:cysteine desulfurase [Actinomycetes bacterium]